VIDTINIKDDLEYLPKQAKELQKTHFNWCGFTWIPHFNDSSQPPIYYYVKLKNLYLKLIGHKLLVSNSLHKLYHNNNYKPFTYSQVVEAFEILNNQLPIKIFDSKIIKLSAGIVIDEDAQKVVGEWQYFLGKKYTPMKNKNKIYGAKYFLTNYQIKGYDKTFEMKNHNQVKLEKPYFRFEIDNCKPNVFNNKTNNIGIYTVKDIVDKEKYKKLGKMLLDNYIKIKKIPKLDVSTLSIKEKRIYAAINNFEIKESIRKQHPHMYKKDMIKYKNIIEGCDNSIFQNQVINKLQQQINYSINN
tara:strand:+ start:188 stop:1090 length:903 start_codon:yes stop_codon:yes gene_type:complete